MDNVMDAADSLPGLPIAKMCKVTPLHIWTAETPGGLCPYCHFSQEARVAFAEAQRKKEREAKRASK